MYHVTLSSPNSYDLQLLSQVAERMKISISSPISEVTSTLEDGRCWNKIDPIKMADELAVDVEHRISFIESVRTCINSKALIHLIKLVRQSNHLGFGLTESKKYVENLLHN